jgi:hypothetical protein
VPNQSKQQVTYLSSSRQGKNYPTMNQQQAEQPVLVPSMRAVSCVAALSKHPNTHVPATRELIIQELQALGASMKQGHWADIETGYPLAARMMYLSSLLVDSALETMAYIRSTLSSKTSVHRWACDASLLNQMPVMPAPAHPTLAASFADYQADRVWLDFYGFHRTSNIYVWSIDYLAATLHCLNVQVYVTESLQVFDGLAKKGIAVLLVPSPTYPALSSLPWLRT